MGERLDMTQKFSYSVDVSSVRWWGDENLPRECYVDGSEVLRGGGVYKWWWCH